MADYDQSFQFDNEASASSKPVNLKLIFTDEIAFPVYTRTKITAKSGDGGNGCIRIMLVDGNQTHQPPVTTGPAASATVKIVLLPANFGGGSTTRNGGVWTPQDFQNNIIVNWGGKKNLLLGNLTVVLKDGVGTLGEIRIKHDGKHLKRDRFRLGAMVVGGFDHEVKEAISDPFEVKDRRNESKDSRQLLPTDKLWRLKKIGKRGPIVRCLESEGVLTVSDFLYMHDSNPGGLQEMCGLYGKRWDTVVHHAKRCRIENVLDGYGSVGSSTSQLSNNVSSFFDSDCYIPQSYHEIDISVEDYEKCGLVYNSLAEDLGFEPFLEVGTDGAATRVNNGGEGKIVLAKKRWMKVRATLWFSLMSCLGTMGSTLAGYAGSKVGATLVD
ncbi:hypothetical protein L6452_39598 [Arctium lappa]|uniref:Uncharacterized protein n=1 Tax=Arctium lappa TaxID=4217 RepID=A0ACB8XTB4_ARCLA|nr:hypothetical protein L6452_39598 [Arctium lappa]